MKAYLQSVIVALTITASMNIQAECTLGVSDEELAAMKEDAMMNIELGIKHQLPKGIAQQYQQLKDQIRLVLPNKAAVKHTPEKNSKIEEVRS